MPYNTLEKRREWAAKNKDKTKQYRTKWVESDKGKEYIAKQKERVKSQIKLDGKLKLTDKQKQDNQRLRDKQRRTAKRHAAINKLGGSCNVCGIDDSDVLQFDHIIPIKRKTNKVKKGRDNYYYVLNDEHPEKTFQLLCANCHTKKTRVNNEWEV